MTKSTTNGTPTEDEQVSPEVLFSDVQATKDNLFVTSKKVVVRYQGISPFKLQLSQKSVVIPEPPTYTVTTATGKKETFFMDEEAAPTLEYGKQILANYNRDKLKAMEEQNEKGIKAIFMLGCRVIDWGESVGWEEEYEILGYPIPEKPREKECFYLQHELTGKEITELMKLVMSQSGATEETIKSAESSFRPETLS